MSQVAEGENLPAELRERLEDALVEASRRAGADITVGNARVLVGLENGRARWVEPTLIRVPISRLADVSVANTPARKLVDNRSL